LRLPHADTVIVACGVGVVHIPGDYIGEGLDTPVRMAGETDLPSHISLSRDRQMIEKQERVKENEFPGTDGASDSNAGSLVLFLRRHDDSDRT
jgi:hypothetical protein